MRARRALAGAALTGVVFACWPASGASAHPLGNFSVNTSARVVVAPTQISIDYVVDLAEIPTFQAFDEATSGSLPDATTQQKYRDEQCAQLARGFDVRVDGAPVALATDRTSLTFADGSAGLLTARLECDLAGAAELGPAEVPVTIVDHNHAGQVGWREVWAVGDRATLLGSDVPTVSPSAGLTSYPTERIASPPAETTATLTAKAGGPALAASSAPGSPVAPSVPGAGGLTESFSALVSRHDLTVGVGVVAISIALVLGAMHAVAPGHGKTVMAAYLVGQRGTLRDALAVGATVTATHTAGVLVLGAVLSTSTAVSPRDVYPWLGILSGALVASVGVSLLWRATRSYRRGGAFAFHVHTRAPALAFAGAAHDHGHGHHHEHDHHHGHAHHHSHAHDGHVHGPEDVAGLGWRSLLAMGFAGGMVPSPSALVVLLGAIALGRTWFGISLVVAYGAGMAVTLLVAGLVLVRARDRIEQIVASERGQRFARAISVLPVATAVLIVLGGALVAVRAANSI